MSANRSCFDVIVIGSGATGSWAAKLLTEGGMTALVIDSGGLGTDHGPECSGNGRDGEGGAPERQQWQSHCYAYGADTSHLFVDDVDQPYETPRDSPFAWVRMRVVGGRTVLWHRVVLRMSDRQFAAASLDGVEVDWPVRYGDLQPHYDAAERFLGVSGIEEDLDEVPDGVFLPTTLPAAGEEFRKAVQQTWPGRRVTALRRVAPKAARRSNAERTRGYPACSAGDALADAEATGLMTLRMHSRVLKIVTDREGKRAEAVAYVDGDAGTIEEASAKIVVMCASTIETTRIMLSSASGQHPDGLGNSNGILGKYLMEHVYGVNVTGVRPGRCSETADIYIPNFRNRDRMSAKFLRGYGIQGHIKQAGQGTIQCDLMCLGEVLPRASNRVTLGSKVDKWGVVVPHIAYRRSDNEFEMSFDQARELQRIMEAAGFEITNRHGLAVPGCSIHEVGTVRMGRDRKQSILNAYNQCWSVRNLFVTDGAAFPSAGFQNPTLTMMAITGRASEYILREFRRDSARPFG